MNWITSRWRWLLFNGFGATVFLILVYQSGILWGGRGTLTTNYLIFDSTAVVMLESGKWAIRFLLICLSMTPFYLLFGWRSAITLRKSAGLWAFVFGSFHFVLYLIEFNFKIKWSGLFTEWFLFTGVLTLFILGALAVTSNRWAMRGLGKFWKRLHRLVYVAGVVAILHGLLAAQSSKKVMSLDPNGSGELKVYLGLLLVLLAIRIPQVRVWLGLTRYKRKRGKRKFAQAES